LTIYRGEGDTTQGGVVADVVRTDAIYQNPAFIASLGGDKIVGDIPGNAENVNGVVAIANGGTGQTTRSSGLNALLPSQTSNNGKFLYTNGSEAAWQSLTGGGDVTNLATTTDNAIARFDGTTGKIIQNSGASIDDSGNVIAPEVRVDSVQLDVSVTPNGTLPGQIKWNSEDGTADLGMNDGVIQQIGLEQYYHVKNQNAYALTNGTVIMAVGTLGNSGKILGNYAVSDGSLPARYVMGVATETIASGEEGYVTHFGLVRQINTTGSLYSETWIDGDVLYAHPTIPGGLTKVEPAAPNNKVVVAIVINAANNGSIFVRVSHGDKLIDLHDVQITSVANNHSLFYDNAQSRWENKSPSEARTALGLVIGTDVQAYDADTAKLDVVQTFTEKQTFGKSVHETKIAIPANNIDVAAGAVFTKTISGATTLTVSNVPSTGTVASFIVEITNGGTNVTWWSGMKWAGGSPPVLSTSGRDVLGFYTHDGGTTWNGFLLGTGMA
jgi:hypothetical protein